VVGQKKATPKSRGGIKVGTHGAPIGFNKSKKTGNQTLKNMQEHYKHKY